MTRQTATSGFFIACCFSSSFEMASTATLLSSLFLVLLGGFHPLAKHISSVSRPCFPSFHRRPAVVAAVGRSAPLGSFHGFTTQSTITKTDHDHAVVMVVVGRFPHPPSTHVIEDKGGRRQQTKPSAPHHPHTCPCPFFRSFFLSMPQQGGAARSSEYVGSNDYAAAPMVVVVALCGSGSVPHATAHVVDEGGGGEGEAVCGGLGGSLYGGLWWVVVVSSG
jgi:hypothetical protein